ncbi:MAG TPA: flagellar basal-body MS-ring/collar protein FliF [Polyangiaceae bacterium]|nr:flagellar basal-body MS-ring/collar protein FliF [Polyangiaceae bacterium]
MDRLRAIFQQLAAFWAKLSTPKRVALVTLTIASLVGVLAVATIGSREHYAYLYTELSTEDAAAIVEKLKTQQVPYQIESGGTAILVPEERVPALRLELASGGLPRGGRVGFEIFDQARIGATEFEQQVSLRRALEGELSRSVMAIDGVKSARVHLVMPERRLFAARTDAASASVVVRLGNSAAFGRREIAAVVHLVSAAVPGLSKDRVSVVSTEGVTLHRPVSDAQGAAELTDLHGEQSRLVASQFESDVLAQLERVVGPGNADVRVNVDLDASTREKTEELYEPSKTALRSENVVEELNGAQEAGVAGVPGARTNLPDAQEGGDPTPAPPAGGGGTTRKSHTRNWEVERVTKKTSTPPGEIQRLSVAVLLNGRWEQRGAKSVFVTRSPEEVQRLEAVVKNAVGFNAERGDSVVVQAAQFSRIEEPPVAADPRWVAVTRQYWPVAAGVAALLGIATMVLVWRRKQKKAAPAVPGRAQLAAAVNGVTLPAGAVGGELGEAVTPPQLAAADAVPFEVVREQALLLAAKDPATAAVVLRQWLGAGAPAAAALPH